MGDTFGWHKRGGAGDQGMVLRERRDPFSVLDYEAGSIADLLSQAELPSWP